MSQYQYKTRAELKNLAKDKLQGKYGVVILMNLALGSFHLLVLLIQSMVNPTGLPAYIGYVALSVMLSVLLAIFNAGTGALLFEYPLWTAIFLTGFVLGL